jgi:hypothetical protein
MAFGSSSTETDGQASEVDGKPSTPDEVTSVEQEQWFVGTVESAISNTLLVRLSDTKKQVWIVVNELTEFPVKLDAASGKMKPTRPRSIDEQGEKVVVEFAVKNENLKAMNFGENSHGPQAQAEQGNGQESSHVQSSVPFVHAAKYANNRSEFAA